MGAILSRELRCRGTSYLSGSQQELAGWACRLSVSTRLQYRAVQEGCAGLGVSWCPRSHVTWKDPGGLIALVGVGLDEWAFLVWGQEAGGALGGVPWGRCRGRETGPRGVSLTPGSGPRAVLGLETPRRAWEALCAPCLLPCPPTGPSKGCQPVLGLRY